MESKNGYFVVRGSFKLGPRSILALGSPPLPPRIRTWIPPLDQSNDEGHFAFFPRGVKVVKVIKLTEACLMSSAQAHGHQR